MLDSDKKTFLKQKLIVNIVTLIALLTIMYISIQVRSSTLDSSTVLDYDPWWWYRHAEDLIENNMIMPKWDALSYYPPGRPVEAFQGWSYTIAIFYKILNPALGFTLTDTAKWSTLIFAAFAAIPAFLLGKKLSNNVGGLATALFGVLTPALIGVSMAGYCDTDMAVVFYSFLSVYSILLAIEKEFSIKSVPYYIFAILVNLAFVFTWGYGWIILLFFTGFMPAMFIFRAVEQMIHTRKFEVNILELKKGTGIIMPLLTIIIITNIIGTVLNFGNIAKIAMMGLSFIQGTGLLVNVSVAELQQMNILTSAGFNNLVERVGLAPIIFTMGMSRVPIITSPLILFMLFKLYRKRKITIEEIFLLIWVFITFLLITRGVRFSLLFSTAASVAVGYVIGNVPKYLKSDFAKITFYGLTVVLMIMFVSSAITTGYDVGVGMRISDNWYDMLDWLKENADPDSLIVTWWDPGHIITGYTGLRVHSDGAHCGKGVNACLIYGHDTRIQDMGRVFSISDEDEALSILEKYAQLTPEQCNEVKETYGDILPPDSCGPIADMYIIASSDLIQKYYWLSYFGTGTGRNYLQLPLSGYDSDQGVLTYGSGEISLVINNEGVWVPVLNFPDQGIRNVLVKEIVYYEYGQERDILLNDTQAIDGMVWVDPSYSSLIFMEPQIRDSIFNKMFFFLGKGLNNFELVYKNPEIRVFKVIWQ